MHMPKCGHLLHCLQRDAVLLGTHFLLMPRVYVIFLLFQMRYKYKRRESCKMLEKVKQEKGGTVTKLTRLQWAHPQKKQSDFILHIKKKIC